jgi:integrase
MSQPRAAAPAAALTVRELVDLYQRHCAADGVHGKEARTQREQIFKLFTATYGDLPVTECKPFHLTDFIAGRPSWRSSATKKRTATAINAAWNWALDEERIDRNPFRRVRYAEAEPRPAMSDDAYRQLCDVANKRFERVVRFLRLTGCRCAEACGLTWPAVDLERGIVTIHRHKSRRYTGRPKSIPLVPEAVELLRSIQARQPAGYDGAVFLTTRDTPWDRRLLSQQFKRLRNRFGIDTPATLHGLRHALAQAAVAAGAPMKLISLQLGHSTSAITERYYASHGYATENIRAAAALGQPTDA